MVAFTGKYVAPEKKRFPVPSGRYNGEVVDHRQTKTAAGDTYAAARAANVRAERGTSFDNGKWWLSTPSSNEGEAHD